jgi:hypothetical protein
MIDTHEIREFRNFQESGRLREIQGVIDFSVAEHVREMISEEQLSAWKFIESLIDEESVKTEPVADHNAIRRKLCYG